MTLQQGIVAGHSSMQLQNTPTRPAAVAGPISGPVRACHCHCNCHCQCSCRRLPPSPLGSDRRIASASTGSHNAPRPPKLAASLLSNQTTRSLASQLSLFSTGRSAGQSYSRSRTTTRKEQNQYCQYNLKNEVRHAPVSRLLSIEEAVSAATIDRLQRLHTQRNQPVLRDRLNRPP